MRIFLMVLQVFLFNWFLGEVILGISFHQKCGYPQVRAWHVSSFNGLASKYHCGSKPCGSDCWPMSPLVPSGVVGHFVALEFVVGVVCSPLEYGESLCSSLDGSKTPFLGSVGGVDDLLLARNRSRTMYMNSKKMKFPLGRMPKCSGQISVLQVRRQLRKYLCKAHLKLQTSNREPPGPVVA